MEGVEVQLRDEIDEEEDQVVLRECLAGRDRVVGVLLGVPGAVVLASGVHDSAPR